MPADHVLVGLDGSPLAEAALTHALESFACPVTVLNVVTPIDAPMSEGGVVGADDDRVAAARDRAEGVLRRAREAATDVQATVTISVETGPPAETILATVESTDVDHVVIGGHGGDRSDLGARLLGTVATRVVSEAPVTVTVVR